MSSIIKKITKAEYNALCRILDKLTDQELNELVDYIYSESEESESEYSDSGSDSGSEYSDED
jgi:hypothetical protein